MNQEQQQPTEEELLGFLNDLEPVPEDLIKQLNKKPERIIQTWMRRTEAQWKEIAGVANGIDIFNYLHPDPGKPHSFSIF
jgi:hypothetical protein